MDRSVLTLSHLYPSSAFPGWGPFVRDEVTALARRNRVGVVAPLPWPTRRMSEIRAVARVPLRMTEVGVPVFRPRLPGIPIATQSIEPCLWAVALPSFLRRFYREIDGDLIHSHFALPDGFAAAHFASRLGVPHVLTILGGDVNVFGEWAMPRRLLRWTFERTDAIIAVSAEVAERAVAIGAESDRVRVLPFGVPYRDLAPRESARDFLDVPHDATCVVWIGRLVPGKQPLDMVEAFARVSRETHGRTMLVMIGVGELRGVVEDRVRAHGLEQSVRVLGFQSGDDLWKWECVADVLVNSSRSEGTPVTVLEALGAGTPIAAYPLPGVRDVVQMVSGGVLARDGTPAGLADAIQETLSGARGREDLAADARSRFAIDVTARSVEEVYDSVV